VVTANHSPLDITWVLICAALVMLMQAGFSCLESGLARSKNSINVAIKNFIDFCISSLVFWLWGYALMFGESQNGLFGTTGFCFDAQHSPWLLTFFLFQLVFCGTSTTILSGAVAERIRFWAYLACVTFTSGLIYPLIGHWAWGGAATGEKTGWLAQLGFLDFAGSTVVHAVGGSISLAGCLVLGPRLGRFDAAKTPMHGHDLPLATLGAFLLWFGWFGFNGGSTLKMDETVPLILVNTLIAGAAGGLAGLAAGWKIYHRPDVGSVINGSLAGLVGITASANIMTPAASVLIGLVAGVICIAGVLLLEKWKIDDVVGAIPVHGFCGVWGTLAVALFAAPETWGTGLTRGGQFLVQALGTATACTFAFGVTWGVLKLANHFWPLRVTADAELLGLNVHEHGASTATLDLLREMEPHRLHSDFTTRVAVDPHTEVGQIAVQYNSVLDHVNSEIVRQKATEESLRAAEEKYRGIFEHAIEGIFQTSPDGQYVSANPALARIYGFDSPEHLVVSFRDIATQLYVDPTRRDDFRDLIARQGYVTSFESQVRRKDGEVIWISENARTVLDASGKIKCYEGTVIDITQRKNHEAELARMHDQLLDAARRDGMAEIATGVLHNVGNVLNSVNVSATLISDWLRKSKLSELSRAVQLIKENRDQLGTFITEDKRGKHLPDFLAILSDHLEREDAAMMQEALSLVKNIDHIKTIVTMQQSYAGVSGVVEPVSLSALVDDALKLNSSSFDKYGIEIQREYEDLPELNLEKQKLLQILVNLVKNAKDSLAQHGTANGRLLLRIFRHEEEMVRIEVRDNGVGIPPENLTRIFSHGFTTKVDGHGFGLHASANTAQQMGGSLIAVSDGPGLGAAFIVELPFTPAEIMA
jgi:Amt family ammonium transporter